MATLNEETKKLDPMEVFQVIGASPTADRETLKAKAEQINASPEVVEFIDTLPPEISEPSQVVAAARSADNNEAHVEMDLPGVTKSTDSSPDAGLSIEEVKTGSPETVA